jgi:hypothetical protein
MQLEENGRAHLLAVSRGARAVARVELPSSSTGAMRLGGIDSSARVSVRLVGASDAPAEIVGDVVRYPGAASGVGLGMKLGSDAEGPGSCSPGSGAVPSASCGKHSFPSRVQATAEPGRQAAFWKPLQSSWDEHVSVQ